MTGGTATTANVSVPSCTPTGSSGVASGAAVGGAVGGAASDGDVFARIDGLIDYAIEHLELDPRDADWTRNRLLALYDESEDGLDDDDEVMGLLSQRPSYMEDRFTVIELDEGLDGETGGESGGMAAMDWFYRYCVANRYVKKAMLDRNPRFDSHGLVVTINLAKPEFKTMKTAAAGNAVSGGYPKCTICHENEGFAGRDKRTLRTIPVTLGGEQWFWQFSPYGYFHQHGICVNMDHTPMHVDRGTFGHLIDFVDRFPGYFLGCNAALPRIGGSVLAHDHYQGGGELLPMHKAGAWGGPLAVPDLPDVVIEILDWPGTAVRVVSRSREDVIAVSERIREAWVDYDDESIGIASRDADGNRQSAISPTVVVTDRGYEMSLIFRNNAVSEEYPEGVFHAHPEFWAIKQEPIGLIEAQGLFILPGRLVDQLGRIEAALAAGGPLPESEREFKPQWDELVARLDGSRDPQTIHAAVRDELGSVCRRILGNTAVFKDKRITARFLGDLGMVRR